MTRSWKRRALLASVALVAWTPWSPARSAAPPPAVAVSASPAPSAAWPERGTPARDFPVEQHRRHLERHRVYVLTVLAAVAGLAALVFLRRPRPRVLLLAVPVLGALAFLWLEMQRTV